MCVNYLAYVEQGTHLPVSWNFNSNMNYTCALYLSALRFFMMPKNFPLKKCPMSALKKLVDF